MIKKVLVAMLVIIITVVIAFVVSILWTVRPLPKTEEMQEYYSERQSEFEKSNDLFLSKLKASEPIDATQNDALGYRFVEAFLLPSPTIKYYTHFRAFGVGAFGTGIAYLEQPPIKIYPSLDAMRQDAGEVESFYGYGHISDNWYYFWWEAD